MNDASRFDDRPASASAPPRFRALRHCHHGQSFGAGPDQDAVGATADVRRSCRAQHRVSSGHRRQSALGRSLQLDRRLCRLSPLGSEPFFRGVLPPAIGLIDACLLHFGDCLLRTIEELLARGHQSAVVLNSDSPTDGAPGRNRRRPRPAGRARRARSFERRRLLSSRHQNRASPPVRRHCLEHRTRRRTDPPTCPRDQARRPHTAGLVRRR